VANRSALRYLLLLLAIGATAAVLLIELGHAQAERLRITSGSMQPTLAVGQVVRLDTSAYASSLPQIGDIVAIRAPVGAIRDSPVCGVPRPGGEVCPQATPERSSQIFVKRVVAGPDDTIAVLAGSAVRNGARQSEPFAAPCGTSQECNFPVPAQVPSGEWFLLGDDRGASDDSRNWGPVPTAWIIGKVVK
jgi:signal peptidase I